MKANLIPISVLNELLEFDREAGRFRWRARPEHMFESSKKCHEWNARNAGKPALETKSATGYFTGRLLGTNFLAHRVVWAMAYGDWPKGNLDHINGDGTDNRLSNLRDVSVLENSRNTKIRCDNTSGIVGVDWLKATGLWRAKIKVRGKSIYLGEFANIEDAAAARKEAEAQYGFHKNHGRVPEPENTP